MGLPRLNAARDRHWVCAQRLREQRLALGLTQREVVARLQGRGHQTTNRALSEMENGRGLDLCLLPELAEALGCTVTYLLGLTSDPSAWQPTTSRSAETPPRLVETVPAARERGTGILGAELPAGFAAPGRARKRHQND
jgi:transcriptional regulator with XRE-family HTH domain